MMHLLNPCKVNNKGPSHSRHARKDLNITSPHICHIFEIMVLFKICTCDICHYSKYVRHFLNMQCGYIQACLPCQNGNFLHNLDFGPKVTSEVHCKSLRMIISLLVEIWHKRCLWVNISGHWESPPKCHHNGTAH